MQHSNKIKPKSTLELLCLYDNRQQALLCCHYTWFSFLQDHFPPLLDQHAHKKVE